ncbi:response regulator [Rhizobium pusense]|nr:response regulator [Agrobacterium pusense]MDH0113270.1 response regulator [Agrobacterium pusense]
MTLPVYLVDDDDAVRKALILLLSTVGIKAKGFADPVAFLSQLAALEPGCLILDIRMPAITGLKLQEKLTEEGIDWPVIIISGHGNIEACRRAFHNGAVDFLSKPVDEQDLIDAIQKAHRILARTLDAKALQAENLALRSPWRRRCRPHLTCHSNWRKRRPVQHFRPARPRATLSPLPSSPATAP